MFPPLALREALVNALCHRDYAIPGGAASVRMFDNRLEVTSTGTLPWGITIADLHREHTSRPHNALLAEIFYRRGLIERCRMYVKVKKGEFMRGKAFLGQLQTTVQSLPMDAEKRQAQEKIAA